MKQAALNSHCQHRHHLCLRHTMWSGSHLCRRLGSHLATSLAGDTLRSNTRLEGQYGKKPTPRHGCDTRLTPRGYHHPSINDSLPQTVRSWMASTPISEDWRSTQVKFKILLTHTFRIWPSGTLSSNNSSQKLMGYWSNSTMHKWATGGPWDTIADHRPWSSLGEDPAEVPCIFFAFLIFAFIFYIYLIISI